MAPRRPDLSGVVRRFRLVVLPPPHPRDVHRARWEAGNGGWKKMKAKTINYAKKELIEFIEVDVPEPQAGEVQIEGLACGVCAWDVHVYKNGVDWPV